MRARWFVALGGLLVVGAVITALLPISGFDGGSCGNVFTASTISGGRYNATIPPGLCTLHSVHARLVDAVALACAGAVSVASAMGWTAPRRYR